MNRNNQEKGIKTRICMISDTHTCPPNPPTHTSNPYRYPLPKADVLLHAGDITKVGRKIEHEAMISMLRDADAELKIVIAGNHDITLDPEYYARMGPRRHRPPLEDPAEIRELWVGEDARKAGIIYLDEGVRTFTLSNGAQFTLYASPYQPEYCQWAFAYERSTIDRFNPSPPVSLFQAPNPIPSYPDVDILLTHGPPYGILDQTSGNNQSVGCEHLLRACVRARPRLHVFGHIHEAYGAVRKDWAANNSPSERILQDPETVLENRSCYYNACNDGKQPLRYGEETLFVNASVVTLNYSPVNAPWVVDVDLPPVAETVKTGAEMDSVGLS
jgi:predicted phosphodiesterase